MSLGKLCFLTTLVVVVALVAVRRLDVPARQFNRLTSNSRSYHPAVTSDESLSYPDHPAYALVRSNSIQASSETRSNVFLAVQSKSPEDLGTGKVLVASRALDDPNFAETVVLLVRWDGDSVVGLILNRPTKIPLSQALDQFEGMKDRSDPVYLGGPVEPTTAFALLRSTAGLDGAEKILSGVYLIATDAPFEKAISGRPDPRNFHVYAGYAGWTQHQLREEVEAGGWFIFQGDARTVFDSPPDSLWQEMIQKTELQSAGIQPADSPSQPSVDSMAGAE